MSIDKKITDSINTIQEYNFLINNISKYTIQSTDNIIDVITKQEELLNRLKYLQNKKDRIDKLNRINNDNR